VFHRVKKILCVQPNLVLRSPEPAEIQSHTNSQGYPPVESSTKRNRHKRDFIFPAESGFGRRSTALMQAVVCR
jgi:hypothetical protein